MDLKIDISEEKRSKEILEILLIDRTTNKNIIWATDDYEHFGNAYNSKHHILYHLITGENSNVIQPRVLKSKKSQVIRTKAKAEVFTPSWICNAQNNLIDNAWFGRNNIFNIEKDKSWESTFEKIEFPKEKNKSWEKYVDENRLEITCGEAPYLVSRYDTVSGNYIDINQRIGILDRKLRVVNENVENEKDWLKWSERAFQSVYGFEFQGDSLLIARENLLATYCDNMMYKLKRYPTDKELIKIAKIISWNIWQMDGLVYTIPFKKPISSNNQILLFEFEEEHNDNYCVIKDWRANKKNCIQRFVK
ncbi:restriction endonuclease subunit M [Streptobacillus moniliformis]|uniref:Restriction endonuclease subunit M n=1 Tax=Streptobacillus moniliformis (strain ATCC 14647 / DSM 12112 / NCTC 10651 / 9901) TaxID=519441 RepID=D1AVX8_STRM9|nr:hypothetical protein [Streptobacillus moniliformis]ACZ01888.1 conserved hypothetical protein [Streptobacillus moniliformis DSM 12112]AVL43121.1 restriction endonuclease subunit M [Streptobacillus moniliformis]SQA12906.1 Uncharacterised protein [Streptobacillus moniliformis]